MRPTRLDLDVSVLQLRCFITVVSAGSVAEAGRKLGISAASVSKAIRRLEDAAGVRVLHRSTHAMSLTVDGEALLAPAREAVRAAQAFEDAAAHVADGGEAGVVRVTGALGCVRHVVAPLVGELARAHPDIRLELRATNEIVDLADEGIDLALRTGPLTRLPGHIQHTWFGAPWVLCAAPGYLARHPAPRTIRELADHELIAFRNRRSGRVEPWPHKGGRYEPTPRLAVDDGDAAWEAMLAGAGIACAPLYLAAAALRSGGAVELLPGLRGADVRVAMVRRERSLTPARVTKLIEFLVAHTPSFRDLARRA